MVDLVDEIGTQALDAPRVARCKDFCAAVGVKGSSVQVGWRASISWSALGPVMIHLQALDHRCLKPSKRMASKPMASKRMIVGVFLVMSVGLNFVSPKPAFA